MKVSAVSDESMDVKLLHNKTLSSDIPVTIDLISQARQQVPAGKSKRPERILTERLRAVLIHFVVGYHVINIGGLYRSQTSVNNAWNVIAILFGYSNWPMQIFVLVAGYAAYFNVRSRGGWGFLKERLARLLVPFVFGVFAWNVLAIWLYWEVTNVDFGSSFTGYFSTLWTYISSCFGGDSDYCLPYYFTLNLWFILELFTFSILTLPLFLVWQRVKPPALTVSQANWIVGVCSLVVLPLLTYGMDLFWWYLPDVGTGSEGNNVLLYLIFFQCGYVMAWVREIYAAVPRFRWYTLAMAVVTGYVVGCVIIHLNIALFFDYFLDFSVWWEVLIFEIFRGAAMLTVWGFAANLVTVPPLVAKYLDFVSYRVIAIYILNFAIRLAVFLLCDRTISALYDFDTFLYFIVEYVLTFGFTILVFDVVFNHKYIHGLVGMWRL